MARAERWRSVAAASAVVERREASALREARAAPHEAEVVEQRFSAFRFPFSVVAEERARNPDFVPPTLDCFIAPLLRCEVYPRMIVTAPVPPPAPSDESRERPSFVCFVVGKTRMRRRAARMGSMSSSRAACRDGLHSVQPLSYDASRSAGNNHDLWHGGNSDPSRSTCAWARLIAAVSEHRGRLAKTHERLGLGDIQALIVQQAAGPAKR